MIEIIVHLIALFLLIIVTMDSNHFIGFEIKNMIIKILVCVGLFIFGAWVLIYDIKPFFKIFRK